MQENKKKATWYKHIPAYIARSIMPLLRLIFRTEIHVSKGCPEDIRKIKGGALLISNHSNFSDPLVMTDVFWRRRLRYIVGENIIDKEPRGTFLRGLGCVRVDRTSVDFDCVKASVKLLREGELLTIYPEGGLNPHQTEISEFKAGAALMAVIANVPIVPMYITPKKNAFSKVRVIIGEPVDAVAICGRFPTAEGLDKLAKALHSRVCELKAELEGEKQPAKV